ncbi:M14 family metallopeptidase [Undibacterium danionis]|uniref:M14-type cytosolic carboxypeptidase n=1 Tax=Undibacterium danionis TaxID=1812100 RepID=A0ABV6IMC6_9BURK
MSIKISQNFDAGAIEVLSTADVGNIQLNLRSDSNAEFSQWFYFRLQGARDQDATIHIMNAGQATYPDGWVNYRAVASYDRENWFRVETEFDGKVMSIKHTPDTDSVYYAYFEPYSWERHLALLGSVEQSDQVRVEDLGSTVDGRDLNLVVVGNPSAKKKVWIIARQHPGETMAEWLVEGTLNALLDPSNPIARAILDQAVLYVVPNMNPDGSVRGNLRTNAAGANLNREWMTPSLETSPEVYHVKKKIEEVGCDLFLDIHGDEGLPYVFVAGSEMLEGFTEKQMQEQTAFVNSFCAASPDFQTKFGYEASKYNEDLLKLASKYIGHTYKCVSLTLELPFKDNANMPDLEVGWDGSRSMKLGEAMLQPILTTVRNIVKN